MSKRVQFWMSVDNLANQSAIARQPKQKIDAVVLAPSHQPLAGKARIGAQHDAYSRPAAADLGDNPAHFFDAAGTGVDVSRAQFGRQQMPAAVDVKRQIAVVVVVAVEEASLLMAMQRVVGGIEVKNDLWRRRGVRVEKEIDEQTLDLRRVIADLVVTRRFGPAPLRRFSVDLLASGAQFDRRAASLPARIAIAGSWRSSSWSIRSS
jgi:hypothetical protein